MNNILKICEIHGELTGNQVYRRKPPRNEILCKKCNNARSAKHRYKKDLPIDLLERKCSRCRIVKNKSEFQPFDWKLTSPYCSICRKENSTKDYDKNRSHLKKRFGITLEEYNSMLQEQNYCCAICKKPESLLGNRRDGSPKRLSVDHCHETLIIRGLLCQRCNQGIGSFLNSKEYLTSAIVYLNGLSISINT